MNERVIIWGLGDYYSRYREDILQMNVIALVDSDPKKQGIIIDGVKVICPEEILDRMYDKIYIMSTSINVIKQQIIELGIPKEKVYYFFDVQQRKIQSDYSYGNERLSGKKAAIISHELTVTGAPNCLLQFAKYLLKNGWKVKVGSPYDGDIKKEFQKVGAECFVDERLRMGTLKNIEWVNESDIIIVNTVLVYYLLRERNMSIPLIWWLHEPDMLYKSVVPEVINLLSTENLHVYTVSEVADKAFCTVCQSIKTKRLMFGVADGNEVLKTSDHKGLRFIVIGQLSRLKGHDVLLQAIKRLEKEERSKCEFLLVGKKCSRYAEDILQELESLNVKYVATGEIEHDETLEILKKSDVLICASRAETVSLAVVEAMMLALPTIVSNAAGIVEYLEDGKNSYLWESENPEALCEKIRWALENRNEIKRVGLEGRSIFLTVFELSKFEERMKVVLGDIFS